jgi:hypothetical protein
MGRASREIARVVPFWDHLLASGMNFWSLGLGRRRRHINHFSRPYVMQLLARFFFYGFGVILQGFNLLVIVVVFYLYSL